MTNAVLECLLNHRSIRRFTSDPIDRETLRIITHAGTRAATAGNLQGYTLVVIDDRAKLSEWVPLKAAAAVISLVDTYRMKRWFELSEAPFHFDKPSSFLISYWDAIIALHNTVIAAESVGLGAVYIGGVICEDMGEAIGAPEYTFPAGLVLLGYPDEDPPLRPRLPDEAVVHFGGYHNPTDAEVRVWYEGIDRTFADKTDAEKETLREKGIRNRAQQITLGRYNERIHDEMSAGIVDNLRRGGFAGFSV